MIRRAPLLESRFTVMSRAILAGIVAALTSSGAQATEASDPPPSAERRPPSSKTSPQLNTPAIPVPTEAERAVSKARGTVVVVECWNGAVLASFGSGFAVGAPDLVATNAHVVQSCGGIVARVPGATEGLASTVVTIDTNKDIAILFVPARKGPVLDLASRQDVAVGRPVLAIGHPEGLELTVSDGIVSALRESGGTSVIQTSAPISPGSSGGPLIDLSGRVVGMATMFLREGQNLNFAVPAWEIARCVAEAGTHRKAFEGAERGSPYSDSLSPDSGAAVVHELIRRGERTVAHDTLTKLLTRTPQSVPLLEQCVVYSIWVANLEGVTLCGRRLFALERGSKDWSKYSVLAGMYIESQQGNHTKALSIFKEQWGRSIPPELRVDILVLAGLSAQAAWPVESERMKKAGDLYRQACTEMIEDVSLFVVAPRQMVLATAAIAAAADGAFSEANQLALMAMDGMTEQNCPNCRKNLQNSNLLRDASSPDQPCKAQLEIVEATFSDAKVVPDAALNASVFFTASGLVENKGCAPARFIKIRVTMSLRGRFLDTAEGYANDETIVPGKRSAFKIRFKIPDYIANGKSYLQDVPAIEYNVGVSDYRE